MRIAIGSSKGGVSKTTNASNLAVHLHNQGHKVAAIDLDGGEFGNKSLTTILGQAEPEIMLFQPTSKGKLKKLLARLGAEYDFTVIDCPGGYSHTAEINLEVLRHSEYLLVPVTPNFDDFEPLSVVERVFQAAKAKNPLLEGRIIINQVDRRKRITRQDKGLKELRSQLKDLAPSLKVMQQTVRIDAGAMESARWDGTVVVNGGKSAAKSDLESLYAELLSDIVVTMNRLKKSRMRRRAANG